MKNKKIIILIAIIILLIIGIIAFWFIHNNNKTDCSKMSSEQLVVFFTTRGYTFDKVSLGETIIITMYDETENISIYKSYNSVVGSSLIFCDKSINDNILDIETTTTAVGLASIEESEKTKQLEAFLYWQADYNISVSQISSMFDYYKEKK